MAPLIKNIKKSATKPSATLSSLKRSAAAGKSSKATLFLKTNASTTATTASLITAATLNKPASHTLLAASDVPALSLTTNMSSSLIASSTSSSSATSQSPSLSSAAPASTSYSSSFTARSIARKTMPSLKFMSYSNIIALLTLLICGLASVNGLKCYMCGQYNEGVGSITPCLNYSDQYAHLYLKECTKKSEKFCVKYVGELSTVRDCATECSEKEIWETQTYCCNEDGCNSATSIEASTLLIVMPIVFYICNAVMNKFFNKKQQR